VLKLTKWAISDILLYKGVNMSKEVINVYWSWYNEDENNDWSFLHKTTENLFSMLSEQRVKPEIDNFFLNSNTNFLSCPAINSKFRNTYVFSNSLETRYSYDFEDNKKEAFAVGDGGLNFAIKHVPSIKAGPLFEISSAVILFADKPLNATFTAPFFHKPGYTNYGSPIPGEFDIGKWFRPYIFEIQMWNKKGEFVLKEEPMFYVSFPSEEKIKMHRFNFSKTLFGYSKASVGTTNLFGKKQTLLSRYDRFKSVGMREKILTEINKNLVDENL
jgi:hypothetical protein